MRLGQVEKTSGNHVLRTLGRVVIDENRIYRLITPVEGWVKEIHGGTTGSIVQKDQVLAHFYSRDILTPQQAYFYVLNALDRFKKEGMDTPQQVSSTNLQIRSAEESLLALGMGEAQIKEIAKTRQAARNIAITAPVTGLVLSRNIYPGLRFDRGTEWYRMADLSRVWTLADILDIFYAVEADGYLRVDDWIYHEYTGFRIVRQCSRRPGKPLFVLGYDVEDHITIHHNLHALPPC